MPFPFRINYSKELNERQYEAVLHKEGPLLVIAGAGSGKTRTLTYRVVRLVEENILPKSILLLTFTRKAAQEMLNRARMLLDQRCEQVSGGTFHAFSNILLRKYASTIGIDSSFTILDRADTQHLISTIKKDSGVPFPTGSFPKTQTLIQIFGKAVNKEIPIDEIVLADYPHFASNLGPILQLHQSYSRHKSNHHLLDYDDLLKYARHLLEKNPEIRKRISERYRYIMVDEYQDTNKVQADILYLITQTHQNIMAVGDDSQSIYAFRGATFQNIMEFPKRFTKTKIIRLEENYRSLQPILRLANSVMDQSVNRYQKRLFTQKQGGAAPLLIRTESEQTQSRFVIQKIFEFLQKGILLKEIAVLFRASFHSFDLEIELNKEDIPFLKVGGFQFSESAHIKDFLSYFKVLANPYDRIGWLRILLLLEKIGPKRAAAIFNLISEKQSGIHGFFEIPFQTKHEKEIDPLKTLFRKIIAAPMPPVNIGETIMKYYQPLMENKYDDHPKRTKEIEHLLSILERYDSLEPFLTDMALEPPNTSAGNTLFLSGEKENRLTLSTIHSAKGLEWRVLFILWALDGRFPTFHAIRNPEELEEELRLLYVAVTRAKDHLFISYPKESYDRTTGMLLNRPSRFLEDVPESSLSRIESYPERGRQVILRRRVVP
ncbi:MAG: ATP-dependent helicase [Thermodesulfobacteriota bacterium]